MTTRAWAFVKLALLLAVLGLLFGAVLVTLVVGIGGSFLD
jgi:hypothetical protein